MGKIILPNIPRPNIRARNKSNLDVSSVIVNSGDKQLISLKDGKLTFEVDLSSLIEPNMSVTNNRILRSITKSIADMANADYEDIATANTSTHIGYDRTVENRVSLPKEFFEAIDFTNMGVVKEAENVVPAFIIGEKYSLKGVSCEGFEMPEKVYELVAIHDEFDGININSLIVKQISGDQDKIFTLSKNDCEHIGIPYEKGLQLFPKHLNWQRVKEVIPFNPSNLGTTPLSNIDNTVRYVLLKLDGFKDYEDGYVVTPSGKIIKEAQFEKTLKIVSNEPIVYTNPTARQTGICIPEGTPLDVNIVYPEGLNFNHGNFISSDDNVYVLITLAKQVIKQDAIDGFYGVEKDLLDGFNPNDHFIISWDELGAYTIEEYEKEKERREKEKQARIAREEARKKKLIEEEEKRIRDRRKRIEEAVERMSAFKIEAPTFHKMETFNMENGLSSLNLYVDGVEMYFDSLDKSLTKISKDLSQFDRILNKTTNSSIFNLLEF